jgi:hypothetical protein
MIELFIFIVVVVLVAGFAVWAISALMPTAPAIFPNAIWVIAGLVVLLRVIRFLGFHDLSP